MRRSSLMQSWTSNLNKNWWSHFGTNFYKTIKGITSFKSIQSIQCISGHFWKQRKTERKRSETIFCTVIQPSFRLFYVRYSFTSQVSILWNPNIQSSFCVGLLGEDKWKCSSIQIQVLVTSWWSSHSSESETQRPLKDLNWGTPICEMWRFLLSCIISNMAVN